MNNKIFYVAGMLGILTGSSMVAASANDSSSPNLQHYYHGRKQVQISDESPIVTVFKKQQEPSYVIEVPNLQGSNSPPAIVIRPSANPAGVVNMDGSPGNLLGANGANGLPPAGIQSNMRSLAAPPQHLASGNVANHVAGTLLTKPVSRAQQGQYRPAMNMNVPQAPVVVATYKPQSVSGSQSASVKTSATGRMLHRGALLN
jgi:hypothetical protein